LNRVVGVNWPLRWWQRRDGEEHPGNDSAHDHGLGRQRFLCKFKVGSGRGWEVQGHGVSTVLRVIHSAVFARPRGTCRNPSLRLQLPQHRMPSGLYQSIARSISQLT